MSKIVEVKDHRGINIYCEAKQWYSHIIAPFTGHAIMQDNIDAIVETIKSPDAIFESHDSAPPLDYREVFCKKAESATYYGSSTPYTKVVVSICGGSGEIVTAYNAKRAEGGTKGDAIYRGCNEG